MSHSYRFKINCPLPADTVIDAFTDFSERRTLYFPNLSRATYEVVERDETSAVVIEGTGPFRTKQRYDWSTRGRIWSVVLESTVFSEGSTTDIRVTPKGTSRSVVEGNLEREYVGGVGRALAVLVVINGRSHFYRRTYLRALKNIRRAGRKR